MLSWREITRIINRFWHQFWWNEKAQRNSELIAENTECGCSCDLFRRKPGRGKQWWNVQNEQLRRRSDRLSGHRNDPFITSQTEAFHERSKGIAERCQN